MVSGISSLLKQLLVPCFFLFPVEKYLFTANTLHDCNVLEHGYQSKAQ